MRPGNNAQLAHSYGCMLICANSTNVTCNVQIVLQNYHTMWCERYDTFVVCFTGYRHGLWKGSKSTLFTTSALPVSVIKTEGTFSLRAKNHQMSSPALGEARGNWRDFRSGNIALSDKLESFKSVPNLQRFCEILVCRGDP